MLVSLLIKEIVYGRSEWVSELVSEWVSEWVSEKPGPREAIASKNNCIN